MLTENRRRMRLNVDFSKQCVKDIETAEIYDTRLAKINRGDLLQRCMALIISLEIFQIPREI